MDLSPIQKLVKKLVDEVVGIDDDAQRWRALDEAVPDKNDFAKLVSRERYWTVHALKLAGYRPKEIAELLGIRPEQVSRELSGSGKTAPESPKRNEEENLTEK